MGFADDETYEETDVTFIDQQVAAAWHQERLDAAQRIRLVRALRAQRRAGRLSQRAVDAVQRATAPGVRPSMVLTRPS